ncbi:hypothetical protein [Rickettsia massiliae]|uniref:hypothetical protein n=1 Tax=Rickettsia massiliae TaxID=35791 RepID=UPI0002E802F9|nr:hypothetical protein [Rickettsia massiliae]
MLITRLINISTIEELKTDSKLLQQIIISKQINRDLTEEEISLLNIGFTFAQISNIEKTINKNSLLKMTII